MSWNVPLTHGYPDWLGVDGYEKLLFDSINGDQSHFVHSDEVMESWRIVDDLLCTGDTCPIRTNINLCWQVGTQHKVDFITKWDYPAWSARSSLDLSICKHGA